MKACKKDKELSMNSAQTSQRTEKFHGKTDPFVKKLKRQIKNHVRRANRWEDILVRLGIAGIVFANWIPPSWFAASDEDFGRVLKRLSGKRDWLRAMVYNALGSNAASHFYGDQNSRPLSPLDCSPQRQVEDSAIQTEIRLLRDRLANAEKTIDELEMKHQKEVRPVFVLCLTVFLD